jgi:hypothetical protein
MKDVTVQFIVGRIVIELLGEDARVIACMAGNVCGYDEWTSLSRHDGPFPEIETNHRRDQA